MSGRLLPKHYEFARLFIKVRWVAIAVLCAATFLVNHFLKLNIREVPIYLLSLIYVIINWLYFFHVKSIPGEETGKIMPEIRYNLNSQVALDFIFLTFILHYSGGIENPFIIYYMFHMIIVSTILSPKESYLQTGLALFLVGLLAFLECYSVIPHYHLEGYAALDLYKNKFYIFGTGFVFITTSFMVVILVNSLVAKSRKIENAYIEANIELEQKDKVKNEYVLRLTHDIKAHLAAILNSLYVVKSKAAGKLNEKQEEFIDIAFTRTNILTDFIKDLLNLTKKRMEKVVDREIFTITDVIDKVTATIVVNAKEKDISVEAELDANLSMIEGDPFSIEEVFSNLLLNAIKYTPEHGHIRLTGRNRYDQVIFEISDDGIGIPENEIPRIFEEFFRASNVNKDKKSGTGLGLSIVKQIIEDHNGRIWVESKLGAGTKFIFTLPKNQPVSIDPIAKIQG